MTPDNEALLKSCLTTIAQTAAQMTTVLSAPAAPAGPTLLENTFEGRPPSALGIITADWWMKGKPGAKRGALDAHWTNYNQITSMMGAATEFDVVCAPDPTSAVEMNPSNYNSCVHHAWEPVVGWMAASELPPENTGPDGWAAYYARFLAAHGKH